MENNNCQFSIVNSQLIKVAVVDDHKIVTDGLERLINESGEAIIYRKSVFGCRMP